MYYFKLAYKNLYRQKLRTLVSIAAIAFAVMVVVFARGYIVGLVDSVFADHIHYDSGHIKIVDRQYHEEKRLMPLDFPVNGMGEEDLKGMMGSLEQLDDVEMVIPRIKFGSMISTEDELLTLSGWGVNPEKELEFTDIENFLVEGKMVRPGRLEVVMGTELLGDINKGVGDRVTILFNTAYNSLNGVTFEIVGRLESGLKMLDEQVFLLPLDQAQEKLYMEGEATELLLVSGDRGQVDTLLPRVKELLDEAGESERYLALGYKETSELLPYMEVAKLIYNQVYIFLVLLACIVVINTMLMIIKDRTKEIGMMSALGLKSGDIMKLFLIEGGIMGTFGSFIGAVFGSVINSYLAEHGINMGSALAGFSSDVMVKSTIYTASSVGNTIFAFVLGVIIVILACIIPARRAAGLQPADALREG